MPKLKNQKTEIMSSLNSNLAFVSELLQADVRLFVKDGEDIVLLNYVHPSQDSLFTNFEEGKKIEPHKDIPVHKAFEMGKKVVGQYGLVINNRPIQEYAHPIFDLKNKSQNPIAVIAIERDIYLTRTILGEHWDLIADHLISALEESSEEKLLPPIILGEGAIVLKANKVLFLTPFAASLVSEIAEHAQELIGRELKDIFKTFPCKTGASEKFSGIEKIEEITLQQRSLKLKHIPIHEDLYVVLVKDISELKVRETLLKEIHHRVKNNLQTVVSLLRMQGRRNPELQGSFKEAISRIKSITLVHEFLSHASDIENIDFGQLASNIIKELAASYGLGKIKLNFHCPGKVLLPSGNATNLALVLNELLSNSLEHGGERLSVINIGIYLEDGMLRINVEDNGQGFPEGFDYKTDTGLGWEIIRTLAEESLGGEITISTQDGSNVELCFKL